MRKTEVRKNIATACFGIHLALPSCRHVSYSFPGDVFRPRPDAGELGRDRAWAWRCRSSISSGKRAERRSLPNIGPYRPHATCCRYGRHDFQHRSSAKTLQGLGQRIGFALLRGIKRLADIAPDLAREFAQISQAGTDPNNLALRPSLYSYTSIRIYCQGPARIGHTKVAPKRRLDQPSAEDHQFNLGRSRAREPKIQAKLLVLGDLTCNSFNQRSGWNFRHCPNTALTAISDSDPDLADAISRDSSSRYTDTRPRKLGNSNSGPTARRENSKRRTTSPVSVSAEAGLFYYSSNVHACLLCVNMLAKIYLTCLLWLCDHAFYDRPTFSRTDASGDGWRC